MGTSPLAAVYGVYLHVLERSGGAARLAALPLPVDPSRRPLITLVVAASGLVWLYAGLASGPHPAVRSFRAAGVLLGVALPVAAFAAPPAALETLGGAALATVLVAGIVHRVLARWRRPGPVSRAVALVRLGTEGGGLALFAAAGILLARGESVPLRLAFWALFLLRLSVSDLLDPAFLASETGLTRSAVRDVKVAVKPTGRRRVGPARRLSRAASGLAKALLVAVWLVLPVGAILAPGEVAAGTWPPAASLLALYPPFALSLTAAVLLAGAVRDALRAPLDALRALLAAVGTAVYVGALTSVPAFASYRASVPALVFFETAFGFLLGAAPRDD